MSKGRPALQRRVTFPDALGYWLKLGFISFGGPAGQIAIMHHELVVRRRWISELRCLPGNGIMSRSYEFPNSSHVLESDARSVREILVRPSTTASTSKALSKGSDLT